MKIYIFEDVHEIRKAFARAMRLIVPRASIEAFPNAENLEGLVDVESPSLVLTDYDMGSDKNGFDVITFFSKHHPETPIILCTGSDIKKPDKCFNIAKKPLTFEEIRDSVLKALNAQPVR